MKEIDTAGKQAKQFSFLFTVIYLISKCQITFRQSLLNKGFQHQESNLQKIHIIKNSVKKVKSWIYLNQVVSDNKWKYQF